MCKRGLGFINIAKLFFCCLLLILTGCSTIQEATDGTPLILLTKLLPEAVENAAMPSQENISGPALYMNIKKIYDKYEITRITSEQNVMSINLNDLKCKIKQPEFYEQRYKGSVYSDLLYQKAVKQALNGFDRKAAITKYQEMLNSQAIAKLKQERENNLKFLNSEYSRIHDNYVPAYENKYNLAKFKWKITDNSGFYDGSIDLSKIVNLNKNNCAYEPIKLERLSLSINTTPLRFYDDLKTLNAEMETIVGQDKLKINNAIYAYEKFIANSTSSLRISINKNSGDNFIFDVVSPEVVDITKTESPVVPVVLVVHSPDFVAIYDKCDDSSENGKEAAKLLRNTADKGFASAQYYLGRAYEGGKGVIQDRSEAAKWYRKAAVQGNADAQYHLGRLYLTGDGVEQNKARGMKWIGISARHQNAQAKIDFDTRESELNELSLASVQTAVITFRTKPVDKSAKDESSWLRNYRTSFAKAKTAEAMEGFVTIYEDDDPDGLVTKAELKLKTLGIAAAEKVANDRKNQEAAKKKRQQQFLSKLKVGDDVHCGMVIEIKSPVVKVQTMIGEKWFKVQQLFPKGEASCKFYNGEYVEP
jgi:hypothetical protein